MSNGRLFCGDISKAPPGANGYSDVTDAAHTETTQDHDTWLKTFLAGSGGGDGGV